MLDVAIILNPGSGGANGDQTASRLIELFAARGREATILAADGRRSVADQARRAVKEGCRVAVAAGGDGTVNAVAAAVAGTKIPLGVLPVGTLNHFAKDLGLPLELEEAVRVAAEGAVRQVDVAEVNGRVFVNNSSLGVYPRIVALRQRSGARGWGKWLAGLWATVAVLRRRPFMAVRIRIDDETVVRRTPFVFVGNNEYKMAGLDAGVRESLTGGRLALYVMHATRRRSLLLLGWKVVWRGGDQVDELDCFPVQEAVVETRRRLPVALDGEVVPMDSPLRYRIRPLDLNVLAP
ncbi:MAG TPA: diacylglycerol kinase family protein [Gemmatimonadales bacterium]|nr:diacylglycerol kinase family protein [Gemmatimonadales bacterium]